MFDRASLELVDFGVLFAGRTIPVEGCLRSSARDLPPDAFRGTKPVSQKIRVELLQVDVNPPALSVDEKLDEAGPGAWHIIPADSRVEDLAQEGRVGVAVEQVEGSVSLEPLFLMGKIEGYVEGPLL